MTPTADPTPLHIIMETTGSGDGISAGMAALIAAGISGVVAIATTWLNLWHSNKRHEADLNARHEESLRGDRIEALSAYNHVITEFVRFVAGNLSAHPDKTALLIHQGQLDVLFEGELVEVSNKLTDRSIELRAEKNGYQVEGVAEMNYQIQEEARELMKLHSELLELARKHITQPPTSK